MLQNFAGVQYVVFDSDVTHRSEVERVRVTVVSRLVRGASTTSNEFSPSRDRNQDGKDPYST